MREKWEPVTIFSVHRQGQRTGSSRSALVRREADADREGREGNGELQHFEYKLAGYCSARGEW